MDNSNPNGNRKRPRDDDDPAGSGRNDLAEFRPEAKLIRVDSSSSIDSDASSGESAARVNPVDSEEFDMGSAEAKIIQQDLLNILNDSETVTDHDPAIQGLDSLIKSFEEEIKVPAPAFAPPVETTSASGEMSPSSQPDLGYLLEASDDELGLPPTNNEPPSEDRKMEAADFTARPPAAALDGMLGFENDIIPRYDAFDFGMGGYSESNGVGEYVPLGGLFDYSDGGASEVPWRMESLSAL
ncbi:uncharacterized protein LOC126794321 [Argentina anserina]|uniref:uncharacterized protein LOC126794321 n=1 Tax=Argentina anserina TaxID=57926 RepID=UPI0021762340|nr:uncharacterized protein LOC126794321 [Potentilla anserina]